MQGKITYISTSSRPPRRRLWTTLALGLAIVAASGLMGLLRGGDAPGNHAPDATEPGAAAPAVPQSDPGSASGRAAGPVGWISGGEISVLTLYRDGERRAVLAAQRAAHMNTLFVTVKQFDGRLWYHTEAFPHLMATPAPDLAYTREDNPLTKVLDDARTAEPRQAVMALFAAFQDAHAARELFPEARIGDLNWVDPAYRPMQDYLIRIAEDLVRNYPIDGISLDFVRYPTGVSASRLPITGTRSRTEVIAEFVERFTAAVRAIDPTVDVSANLFANTVRGPVQAIGQDLARIARTVDFVLPMLYPYDFGRPGAEEERFGYQYEHVTSALRLVDDADKVKPNVQGFFDYSFAEVAAQIRGVREAGGTGAMVYAYDFDTGWRPEEWRQLAAVMPERWWERRFRRDDAPPALSDLRVLGATVALRTEEPARVAVEYGPTVELGRQAEGAGWARHHAVLLPDLEPGATYHYRVLATDPAGNVAEARGSFVHAAPPDVTPAIADVAIGHLNDVWAVITWRTDRPTVGAVEYGDGSGPPRVHASPRLDTEHRVHITDLEGDRAYEFRVRAMDAWGAAAVSEGGAFATPRNLALGKPATASSAVNRGFEADKATDGSLMTRWSSIFADWQYITVDLEDVQAVAGVGLEWEYAYARSYAILVSTDGEDWLEVYGTDRGNGGREDVWFAPVEARYVRLVAKERATALGSSLWEFKVFGPS